MFDVLPSWVNPFDREVADHSTTPLLLALRGPPPVPRRHWHFQVVIDQERDTGWVSSATSGERVGLLATGTVNAYVDFTDLGRDRVALSPDGESATITLPGPQLGEGPGDPSRAGCSIANARWWSELATSSRTILPTTVSLYARAEDRLESAAVDSDLQVRAEDNTQDMLTTLGQSLGVDSGTVTFEPAPAAAG